MKEKIIKVIEDIVYTIPEDSLIPFKESIDIAAQLLRYSGSIEPIKEIIQFIKKRHIEDLITIHMATTILISAIVKKEGSMKNYNLPFVSIIKDELSHFPGGFGTRNSEELQPLVYKIVESSTTEEWAIINSEPDVFLLDTDLGLATIGVMALVQNDHEMQNRIYAKRDRIAPFRKQIQDAMDSME